MRKIISVVASVVTLTASLSAFAQGGSSAGDARCAGHATTSATARDQELCFTDTNVSGTREGSMGANSVVAPRAHGPSLIRHRAHFSREMLVSVENF